MKNLQLYFLSQLFRPRFVVKSVRGFTIIETLVAIAILMIAIAGPLVIATKGLTSALYSKDQMIASFLARESMEVIRNKKANDASGGLSLWLDTIMPYGNCNDLNSNICDASSYLLDEIKTGCDIGTPKGCRLYYDSSKGYTHDSLSGTPTKFYRYYYIDSVAGPNAEKTVHVLVDWKNGTIPYQIDMTNQITNIRR